MSGGVSLARVSNRRANDEGEGGTRDAKRAEDRGGEVTSMVTINRSSRNCGTVPKVKGEQFNQTGGGPPQTDVDGIVENSMMQRKLEQRMNEDPTVYVWLTRNMAKGQRILVENCGQRQEEKILPAKGRRPTECDTARR